MPDFPIIDTHLHLWDTTLLRYRWLDGDALLNQPYLPPQYNMATQGEQVEKMIFVQCEVDPAQAMQETEWVSELAEQFPRIAGIIASAPLERGDAARPLLERLAEYPRVKGVRRLIQDEPSVDFCIQPNFVRGVQALADYGFSFEICVYPPQIDSAIQLVRQCPNVQFVLDHIGKPYIRDRILDPWRDQLRTMASLENVVCKVSGLVNEADQARWTMDDLKPYIDHTLDCFGFERVMFGGDWPVILWAAQWQQWVDALVWGTSGASRDERIKLFHDNAIRVYRLG